ncbi:MAG: hypothetical protein ABF743_11745 [Schleiferilactobacillus perolens]|uniref:hypothetical protein n=1 Tax=Schleiferilactobacillus perolens TaxID=100468 RepID=UPI0039EC4528
MDTIGSLISMISFISLIYGAWQWRKAAKTGEDRSKPKKITALSGAALFFSGILMGANDWVDLIGMLFMFNGLAALVYGGWRLYRSVRTGKEKRSPLIIVAVAIVVLFVGSGVVNASPANQQREAQQAAQSSRADAKSESRKIAAEEKTREKKEAAKQKSEQAKKRSENSEKKATAKAKAEKAKEESIKVAAEASSKKEAEAKSSQSVAESTSRAEVAKAESARAASESASRAESASIAQANSESASRQAAAAAPAQQPVTNNQNGDLQQTVYVTSTGGKYHFSQTCRGLRRSNSTRATTLGEAQAQGFTRCGFE